MQSQPVESEFFKLHHQSTETFLCRLFEFPPSRMTQRMCFHVVFHCNTSPEFKTFPNGLEISYNAYLRAVSLYGSMLKFVHAKYRDHKMCMAAFSGEDKGGYALCYVPYDQRDEEVCLAALECGYCGIIDDVPHELRKDPKFCMKAVKISGNAIGGIYPQTYELCLAAVQQNGHALSYLFISMIEEHKDLVIAAVKQTGYAIANVLPQFRSDEAYRVAFETSGEGVKDFIPKSIYNECVNKNKNCI